MRQIQKWMPVIATAFGLYMALQPVVQSMNPATTTGMIIAAFVLGALLPR